MLCALRLQAASSCPTPPTPSSSAGTRRRAGRSWRRSAAPARWTQVRASEAVARSFARASPAAAECAPCSGNLHSCPGGCVQVASIHAHCSAHHPFFHHSQSTMTSWRLLSRRRRSASCRRGRTWPSASTGEAIGLLYFLVPSYCEVFSISVREKAGQAGVPVRVGLQSSLV